MENAGYNLNHSFLSPQVIERLHAGKTGILVQFILYSEKTVIFGNAFRTARGTRLNQTGIQTDGNVGDCGILCLAGAMTYYRRPPGLLRHHVLQGFADTVVPVACPTLPMYLIWHRRYESDPAHEWLRRQVLAVSDTVGAEQGGGPAGTG